MGFLFITINVMADGSIQQPDNRFYVSGMYSYRVNCIYCSGKGWFFGMGKPLSMHWGLELNEQTYHEVGISPVTILQRATGLNVLYFPWPGHIWNPYIELGAGKLRSVYGSGVNHNYLSAGVGVFWQVAPYLDLRGDIRFNRSVNGLTPTGSAISGSIISVGLAIPFGSPPSAEEQTPAPSPVQAVPVKPVPVKAVPHTSPVLPVNQPAITPLQKVIVLSGIHFAFNSADLTMDSQDLLNQDLAELAKYPNVPIEVAGYTDNIGSVAYNLNLSLRRAEAVRNYFIVHGVAADRLVVRGYGMADPAASNATEEGRAENRRIELHIFKANCVESTAGQVTCRK